MIKKLTELNEALPGILIADILYLVLGEILILLLIPNPRLYAVGFLIGVICAVICIFHMSFQIRKVVYGKADSTKTMVSGSIIRMISLLAVAVILYIFNIGDFLSSIIGMFALKISAYLQPYIQAFASKIFRKGG